MSLEDDLQRYRKESEERMHLAEGLWGLIKTFRLQPPPGEINNYELEVSSCGVDLRKITKGPLHIARDTREES